MLLTLTEIIELFPCRIAGDLSPQPLQGISTDSRSVKNGELFVAIRGEKFDGHVFVDVALKNGAVAALVENDFSASDSQPLIYVEDTLKAYQEMARYYRQKMAPTVVALTGSAGKTTCKEFLHAVLSQKFSVHKNTKSFNNHIGVPATLLDLQPEHEILVAELGTSNFGEISHLSYLVEPDVCVLLNIGYAHVEFLKSLDGVANAKMEIFDHAHTECLAIYNRDDETLSTRHFPSTERVTFGLSESCDVKADNIRCDLNGRYQFTVDGQDFQLSIPGRHNIYNALAAICVGRQFAVPMEKISRAVESVNFVEHRMTVCRSENYLVIDDAYNANPGSCKAALQTLADISRGHGRRIAVLADMLELGEFAQSEHEKLAVIAKENKVDALFLFGRFTAVLAQRAQQMDFQLVKHFENRDELIRHLKAYVNKDDVILVKGSRSMQMEHVVNALMETA